MTGIGEGTAFGILVLLMIVIVLIWRFSKRILGEPVGNMAAQESEAYSEARDKALAAVIAVTALTGSRWPPEGARNDGG